MKAAVLHEWGGTPRYEDFPDQTVGEDERAIRVKAVSLENIDRAMAQGTHYGTKQFFPQLPAIIGFDGIGETDAGELVALFGIKPPYGAMAEKVVMPKAPVMKIPEGVTAVEAAALPAPLLTGLFPLKYSAKLQAGETVLIQGATGFSGGMAVQIAKKLGAGRVVGSGRDAKRLAELTELGADAVIDLTQSDEDVTAAYLKEAGEGYDVILDFLWGHPTELLISTIVPSELGFSKGRKRLIQIGEMAGATLALPADALRTSGLEIYGGGAGITPEAIGEATELAWGWIRAKEIKAEVEVVPLSEIEKAWERNDVHGKRVVIVP